MSTSNLNSALDYARRGWAVVPIAPDQKTPATRHGVKDATTDPQTIRRWFADKPRLNVAIATGMRSGLVVVDADLWKDPDCLSQLGDLPRTRIVETPRGGRHFYFAAPPSMRIRSTVRGAVDIQAEGKYVLAPTSTLDGRPYQLAVDAPVAELPEGLTRCLFHANKTLGSNTDQTPTRTTSVDSDDSVTARSLRDLVSDSLPAQRHTNNAALFRLARGLMSHELVRGRRLTAAERTYVFDLWHDQARVAGFLRPDQDRDGYFDEFLHALKCARIPLGGKPVQEAFALAQTQRLPIEAAMFSTPERQLLVGLCYQLHHQARGGAWWLSCRTVATLFKLDGTAPHVTAARWIRSLVNVGLLEIVDPGNRQSRISPRFRWVGAKPQEGEL